MSVNVFYDPRTLAELRTALASMEGEGYVVAGCTDFLAKRNGKYWHADTLVSVANVAELQEITLHDDRLTIGAACVHHQVARNEYVRKYFPGLADACGNVGSPQIRNRGTIGGSLANSSPAGDMLPALLTMDAGVVIVDGAGADITVKLDDFVQENGKTILRPGQALAFIELPLPKTNRVCAFSKLGERAYVTIAKINTAISLEVEDGVIHRPLVTLGAVARRSFFSADGAAALEGKPLTEETFDGLAAVLAKEIEKAIPTRETMPYKRAAIRGVVDDLYRLLKERAGV